MVAVADPGGPRGPGPPSPHFWGPRLYSEAQIAPFYTQITEKFCKKFCLTSLGILFQFSIDIFWSKTLKNYSFLRPQIIFWGPNCTFLHSNNRKIFKIISLALLGILFQFSIDIFYQKHYKIIHFWGPRLYSEAQITPSYT